MQRNRAGGESTIGWLFRGGKLWFLTAILGAVTLYSMVITIHDSSTQRRAIGAIAGDVARDVSNAASNRAERLALETFAPVLATEASTDSKATLQAIADGQQRARECACRDTLPASGFFYLRPPTTEQTAGAQAASALDGRSMPPWSVIAPIVSHDMNRARSIRRPATHVTVSKTLGDDAILTIVDVDRHGAPIGALGVVAPASELMAAILGELPAGDRADTSTTLVRLRAHAVQVATADSAIVYGSLDSTATIRATAVPSGPLDGLVIRVAIRGHNVAPALMMPVSHQRLMHTGLLTICTVIAIIFAIGSSRREALLARARSDFIAGVSHDLRMPLAQVLLAGETLAQQRDVGRSERVALSTTIVREVQRLIGLIENVLLFSRSGAVKMRARLEPFSASSVLEDVAEAVELTARDAGQSVTIDGPGNITALGDARLVRQALVNLADNAIKYGPAGQVVRLSVSRIGDAGNGDGAGMVRFAVTDSGPGIPENERTKVFAPYARLERDQTSSRTGAGLGLAVVDQIARACRGRVWLEDASVGQGTRAVLQLGATSRQPAHATTTA